MQVTTDNLTTIRDMIEYMTNDQIKTILCYCADAITDNKEVKKEIWKQACKIK